MKKILIPVDFSPTANNALEYAAQLASTIKAELQLIHAVELSSIKTDSGIYEIVEEANEDKKQIEKKLKNYCNEIRNEFNVKCSYETMINDLHSSIRAYESTNKPDLIIMGTNGEDSLMDYLFGTKTFKVISEVKCPVLVVPILSEFTAIKNVVYASNYQKGDIISLHQINKLLWPFKPKVTVLHISSHDTLASEETFNNYAKQLSAEADKDLNLKFERVLEGDVPEAIDDFLEETNADLLTVCTRHAGIFNRIFNKSVTRMLTVTTEKPILIFHE